MERIPILRMGEFLLVTIQVDMHDQLAMTLQDDLAERLGARVSIDHGQRGKGKLVIEYTSLDELDGILGHIK